MEFWSVSVFLQLVVVAMALNQTWVGILTFLLCAVPNLAFRLSPVISSLAGFTSGFFIPRDSTPWVYRWLFFINPNYYGFSASANILLRDFGEDCRTTNVIECYLNSGEYILDRFNFNDIKIYQNVAILLLMTLLYLILAALSNWLRHTSFFITLKTKFRKKSGLIDEDDDSLQFVEEGVEIEDEDEKSKEALGDLKQTTSSSEDDKLESTSNSNTPVEKRKVTIAKTPVDYKNKWKEITVRTLEQQRDELERQISSEDITEDVPVGENDVILRRPERLNFREKRKRKGIKSLFLGEGEEHMVYKPGNISNDQTPGARFANVIEAAIAQKAVTPIPTPRTGSSLKERQMEFDLHTKTTQEVVKEQTEEFINSDEATQEKLTLREVTKRVTERMKQSPRLASVVGEAVMKFRGSVTSDDQDPNQNSSTSSDVSFSPSNVAKLWRTKAFERKAKLQKGFSSESEENEVNIKPSVSSSQQEEGYSPSKMWRAKTRKHACRTDKTSTSNLVAVPVQKFLELRKKKPTITSSSTSKSPDYTDGPSQPILKKTQSESEFRVRNLNRLWKRKTETEMLHLQPHFSDSSSRDCVSPFNDDVFITEEPIEVFRSASQLKVTGDVITEVDEEETEVDMEPSVIQDESPQKGSNECKEEIVTIPTVIHAHSSIPDIHIESSIGTMPEIPFQPQTQSSDPISTTTKQVNFNFDQNENH